MTFATGYLKDFQKTGSGVRYDPKSDIVLTAGAFETGLKIGRFAKYDADSLDNMDGSATPIIAGVVLGNEAGAIEEAGTYDADLHSAVQFGRSGLFTVDVKSGELEPDKFGAVYASNAGDADDGLATSTGTDVATSAEFVSVVDTTVWLVRLK